MNDRPILRSRRNFLLALGIGGAGTALAGRAALAPARAAAAAPAKRSGYRRTAHIGNYYRTAKF